MWVGTRVTAVVAAALAAPLLAFTAAQTTVSGQPSDTVVAEYLIGWGDEDCYDNDCWNEGGDNDLWNEHFGNNGDGHEFGYGNWGW
jgi:hypothetical protein